MHLQRHVLLYLFSFALIIRIAVLAFMYQGDEPVRYFEDVGIAINLYEGRGYVLNFSMIQSVPTRPTAAKPPVYPFLVVLVFLASGAKNFFVLFAVHAVLAALTAVILYLAIARFSRSVALLGALAFSVYPPFVYHSMTVPESTTLLLFVLSLFCYALVTLNDGFVQRKWILTAMLGGVLCLTEPVTVPFVFLAFGYVAYLTLNSWKNGSLQMMVAVFVFSVTVAPWSVRNYLTFHELVLFKSSFGSSLKDSMYRSGVRLPSDAYATLVREVQGMNEVKENEALKRALMSWIVANPLAYAQLIPKNFRDFWWETDRYKNDRSAGYILGRKIPYLLLLIVTVPVMAWRLRRLPTDILLGIHASMPQNIMLILIVTYTTVYMLFGSWNLRYHFPVQLGMLIFCAEAFVYMANKAQATYRFRVAGVEL